MQENIFITKSTIPNKEIFLQYIDKIFETRQFTNNGPLVKELETKLRIFLDVPFLALCANGTLSLSIAIRSLGLNGKKILVSPFTYVATLNALLWEGCTPIFVDIDKNSLCMSVDSLKEVLHEHPDAAGILPVHVYGVASDTEEIEKIAQKYDLPIIYDGAHAFDVSLKNKNIFNYGDISICSFHATKIFHTGEGGCIICKKKEILEKIHLLRAFGHIGDTYRTVGINAKMSELSAAMGLSLLPYIQEYKLKRKSISALYDHLLTNTNLQKPIFHNDQTRNYAYYPIIFSKTEQLETSSRILNQNNIYPRRYFFPSCNSMPFLSDDLKKSCPVAEDISSRILCLPLYPDLERKFVEQICAIITRSRI